MPRPALVLIAVGEDCPGIVDRVSGAVYRTGCNVEDSRMSTLGGEFALMVLVSGGENELESARSAVVAIGEELGLSVQSRRTEATDDSGAKRTGTAVRVRAESLDHPGIVHKVTRLLASKGVNVTQLETTRRSAPTTGTPMFVLSLDAIAPAGVTIDGLRRELEDLGSREGLDLDVRDVE